MFLDVCLIILSSITVFFLRFLRLRIRYSGQILACKQKQRCGWLRLGPFKNNVTQMFQSKVTSSFSHFTFFKGTRSLLENTHSLLTPSGRHRLVENSLILCCQAWKCSVLYLGDPLMSTMCYWRQQMHLHKREGKIYLRHCSGWSSGSRCKTVYWIPLDDLRVIRIYNVTA